MLNHLADVLLTIQHACTLAPALVGCSIQPWHQIYGRYPEDVCRTG